MCPVSIEQPGPGISGAQEWQCADTMWQIVAAMPKHIAIVEDEPAIRENYTAALKRHGYEVSAFSNRQQAMEAFRNRLPDLAIVDITLEDEVEGGFDLCRELRSYSETVPIIFLTARDSEVDAVSGLRLGADDYLTKDISLPHLVARIVALLRRVEALSEPVPEDKLIKRGDLSINLDTMSVHWQGTAFDLTVTEFWLVHALARHPGHVKNRDQLMQAANAVLDDNTITSHIKRIRKKFAAIDGGFDAIETVYGMGYRWKSAGET